MEFKATGSITKFKGFLAVYQESKPEDKAESGQEEKNPFCPSFVKGKF